MSWGPLLDFYINNRSGINDIIELEKRTRAILHKAVAEFLCNSVRNDIESWDIFPHVKIDVQISKNVETYIWWADIRFYDDKREVGTCFNVYISASALMNPRYDDVNKKNNDYPVMYIMCEGIGGRLAEFKDAVSKIKSKTIMIGSPWSSKSVLAYKPLTDVLNLEALKDQQTLAELFCKEVKEFSELFAPIIPSL
jgi:hypothetical protein